MTLYNVFRKGISNDYSKAWLCVIKAESEEDLKRELKSRFPEYSTEDFEIVEIINEMANFYEIRKKYHEEDAEDHLHDYFEGMSDENILEIMHYDNWNALLSNLAENFENVKDCNVPDNDMWEAVIRNRINDAS